MEWLDALVKFVNMFLTLLLGTVDLFNKEIIFTYSLRPAIDEQFENV